MHIDLHTHSTASDGTFSPADVMTEAGEVGLDVVALTDHDTTAGWDEAAKALPAGLTLVPGAELSCRWHDASPSVGLHMLAYLFDRGHAPLADEMARVRGGLESRAMRMVELLNADRHDVSWEQVRENARGDTVGRPHIAEAMLRRGVVRDTDEAFGPEWLGGKYHVPKQATEVFLALRLIRAAGGVAVVAHARRSDRVVPDELLAQLANEGLFGLEADHPEHSLEQRTRVRARAANLGLVVTGSSDFHGTAKKVQLAAHTTEPEVYERIVAAATGTSPISSTPTVYSERRR